MFFLVTQTFLLILLAFLFGLFIGWLIWGRKQEGYGETSAAVGQSSSGSVSVLSDSLLKTQRELESCQQSLTDAQSRMQELELRYKNKNSQAKAVPSDKPAKAVKRVSHGDRDDLKLIFGIGPFIERKLAEIDITTYKQIADLSDEDILRVGEYLNYFPGRIERDNWLSSARELHMDKYGEKI